MEDDSDDEDDDNNNNYNNDNNDDDEDGVEDDINDEENSDIEKTTPPKLKLSAAVPAPNKKSPRKEPGVENITAAVSKKLKIASKPYSMVTLDGYMVKPYCQKFTDHVEVDIHIAGVLKDHSYKVELSTDGLALIWKRATPDYVFESKRMITQLGRGYHPDESRVIAHDDVVQQIRKGGTENNGVHFAPEADAMVIQLGVVCTGTVRVKEFLKKIDEVIHGGHTHFQFNTVYSCKVQVMLQRTIAKKKAWQSVSVDVEEIDQGEDSEGEDYNDEEMAEQVGSHF